MVQPLSSNAPQTTASTVDDNQIQPNAQPVTQPDSKPTQPNQPAPDSGTTQPAQPQAPPTAQKRSMFDRVLRAMSGSPTVVDPKTGEVSEVPMTKATMSQHILAGAISSILNGAIAGGQASANAPAGPAGTNAPGNMAAMGAGAKVGQDTFSQMKSGPQNRADQVQVRQAAAMKNTLTELQNQVAIDKLHDEDWSSKENFYQAAQDTFRPVLNDFEKSDQSLAPGQPSLFAARGLSHEDAMKQMQGKMGQLQPIQDGWTTQVSPDGKTFHVPTYSLVRTDGQVNVSRGTLGQLAQYDSRLANVLAQNSSDSVQLSPTMLVSMEKNAHQGQIAEQFINSIRKGMGEEDVKGFNSAYRDDPVLRGQVDSLMTTLGSLGTHSTASALEEFMDGGKGSQLMKFFGKTPDELSKFVQDKKAEVAKAQSEAKSAGAIEVAKIKTQGKPMSDNFAASILSDPNSNPVDRARAESFHSIQQNWKETAAKTKAETDRSLKVGDPSIAARLLYDGTLTLSQLKARSSDARFIADVTSQAQQMARGAGDNTWTPQVGESYFKVAQTPANQQFFGNVNSLIAPTGTLSQLQQQYDKLGNVQFPKLNSWEDYLAYQLGEEKAGTAMAGFAQTALAVADDYAKVMGGAVGTDTARMDLLKRFSNAHNPAQFQAVVEAARAGIKSQAAERIGHNSLLQQMYGENVPENAQRAKRPTVNTTLKPQPPAGATSQRVVNGTTYYRLQSGSVVDAKGQPAPADVK